MALVLQALGSDQALDTGSLGVRLLALTLWLHLTSNDVLADLLLPQACQSTPSCVLYSVFGPLYLPVYE